MEFAIVRRGVVVNVIIADDDFVKSEGARAVAGEDAVYVALTPDTFVRGSRPGQWWTYDGKRFAPGSAPENLPAGK